MIALIPVGIDDLPFLTALQSNDFGLNLVAELIGVTLESTVVYVLLRLYVERRERNKWWYTRHRLGSRVGWQHTILLDKLSEGEDGNAYIIVHRWCEESLKCIKEVKQEYSYAFTPEMAGALETYEGELSQHALSIEMRQWRALDTIKFSNDILVAFLKTARVLDNDIKHLFAWSDKQIMDIIGRLTDSDPNAAAIPKNKRYFRA